MSEARDAHTPRINVNDATKKPSGEVVTMIIYIQIPAVLLYGYV